jgi:hypothetical protein
VWTPAALLARMRPVRPVIARLDEIADQPEYRCRVILAEIGLDMNIFPSPGTWW